MTEIAAPVTINDEEKIEDENDAENLVEPISIQVDDSRLNANPFQAIIDTPVENNSNQAARDNQNL